MEPITHFLTGACIGRAGLNRKTAYATLAAVLASEAADVDVLWALRGPVEELKHHRGITHTFIAAPVVAGVVVGAVWLFDRWREARRIRKIATASARPGTSAPDEGTQIEDGAFPPLRQEPNCRSFDSLRSLGMTGHGGIVVGSQEPVPLCLRPQPVRWGWVYLSALLSALSHLFLDWTNNYGLRPFFPFNPRWYAGSFMFIAEPLLWALLLAALVMPWLFGLIGGEIGARRKPFRGQGWAIFALSGMALLWCWRWAEHAQALAMVENTQITAAPVKRVAIEPYPVNPFRWHAILETEDYYQTAEIDTRAGSIDTDQRRDVLFKPASTAATEAAKRTPLGRVYLDWGTWAVVRDVGPFPVPEMDPPQLPLARWTTVEFTDLRFSYSFLGTSRGTGRSPLGGWVYIVDGRDDAGEALNGREQK
jgi:inner membrane protein